MLGHYLSVALRNLWRLRLVTTLNVLCLAVGITCFLMVLAATRYIYSSDSQWSLSDRTMVITQRMSDANGFDTGTLTTSSPPVARYLKVEFPQLTVARIEILQDTIAVAAEGKSFPVQAGGADATFLQIFDIPLLAGSGRDVLSQPKSIVLTQALARRIFGTTEVVGQSLLLENSISATVTGVIDRIPQPSQFGDGPTNTVRFDALFSFDVLEDLARRTQGRSREEMPEAAQWGNLPYGTYVLLPENGSVRPSDLNERLQGFAAKYIPPQRTERFNYEFAAIPVTDVWMAALEARLVKGSGVSVVWVLYILGGAVLLMASLNYANSATALAIARTKEAGMHKVLGATASQVALQHVLEAAIATFIAMVIGILALVLLVSSVDFLADVNVLAALGNPLTILLICLGVCAVVSLVAGLYPGFMLAHTKPVASLQSERSGSSGSQGVLSRILVGVQFAMVSFLLLGVFIVYAQNAQLREDAIAHAPDPVVVIGNDLRKVKLDPQTLRSELGRSSAIRGIATSGEIPWMGDPGTIPLARSSDPNAPSIAPMQLPVSKEIFDVLGIRLMAGRLFDDSHGDDMMPTDPRQVDSSRAYSLVVDRPAAEALGWRNPAEAVDQVITVPLSRLGAPRDQAMRIIGVVENTRLFLAAPSAGSDATAFMLMPQRGYPVIRLDRARLDEGLQFVDATWSRLAPNFPVNRRFVDDLFEQSYATYSRINSIVLWLAFAAFAIAVMGLYAMATLISNRRVREIGVRKSLGASTPRIATMLIRDFSTPVIIANLVAWPLAYIAAQFYLSTFVNRIALTPWPFILSLAVVVLIAWLAVAMQTARVARLNPATVLRYE